MWLLSLKFRQLGYVLIVLLSGLSAQAVLAAKKTTSTELTIGGNSDSNRQLRLEEEQSSSQLNGSLNQRFQYQTQRNELFSSIHIKRHEDLDSEDLSYNDYMVTLSNNTHFQRWDISTSGTFVENSSLVSEVDNTGITTINKTHRSAKYSFSSGYGITPTSSLFVALNSNNNWYDDSLATSLLDYQSNSAQSGYRMQFQRNTFDLYIYQSQLEIQDTPTIGDNRETSYGAGFEYSWQWNEKDQLVFGSSRQKTQSEFDYLFFNLAFPVKSETWNTQYKLSWSQRFERSSFTTNIENRIQDQSNGFSERKELSFAWQRKPANRWNLGLRLSFFQNDIIWNRSADQKRTYSEVTLSSDYRLKRDQSLNLYVKYRGQDWDLDSTTDSPYAKSVSVGFNYRVSTTGFIY